MKWFLKWVLRLAILMFVLLAILFFSKDAIVRAFAEHRIRKETGMDVRIGRLSSSVLSPVVTIENLRLYNTPEFGGTLFLEIPELHIECDPVALAQQKLRITLLRLNLSQLNLVRNQAGKTNIFSMAEQMQKRAGDRNRRGSLEDFDFVGVEVLNLSLGRARYVDLGNASNNREFTLNLENQVFNNVKSEADLYGILFIIWLRSGGALGVNPGHIARDYMEKRIQQVEAIVRSNLIHSPAAPPRTNPGSPN